MVSQPVINVILGAGLSGILLIISSLLMTWTNNKFQLDREKEQRMWQEKSDQEKWYREKVYASYTKAIQILTEIIKQRVNEVSDDINSPKLSMIKLFIEFDSEYIMIIRSHPDRDSNNFEQKISEIDKSIKEEPWIARDRLIEIMEQDSRIKPVNNNLVIRSGSADTIRIGYIGSDS